MKVALAFCIIAAVTLSVVHSQEQRVQICEPGSVFMDDCNRCRCSIDGLDKSCTRIQCVHQPNAMPDGQARRRREVSLLDGLRGLPLFEGDAPRGGGIPAEVAQ